MLFDLEAIRGIYYALSAQDTAAVQEHCSANGIADTAFDSERKTEIVYNALVALGHIIPPPPPPPTDAGAAEYQDAMNALALMGD